MPETRTTEYYLNKFNITKEWLIENYVNQEKSLPDIYNETGMSFRITKLLLERFEVKIRSRSEAKKTSRNVDKTTKTLREKYGVDNASKSNLIKEKKKNTFFKNYGVDNIWKSAGYCQWLNNYMLLKYGKKRISNPENLGWKTISKKEKKIRIQKLQAGLKKWFATLTDEQKSEIAAKAASFNKNISKLESRFQIILNNLNIGHKWQFRIKNKIYDFLIDKTNIIIEINGDFWHANPKIYTNENELIKFPFGKISAKEIWEKDNFKKNLAINSGYKIVYLWESEIKKMSDSDIENFILNLL